MYRSTRREPIHNFELYRNNNRLLPKYERECKAEYDDSYCGQKNIFIHYQSKEFGRSFFSNNVYCHRYVLSVI